VSLQRRPRPDAVAATRLAVRLLVNEREGAVPVY
jgi:hypothetical protein